jgi:predicted transcriptional regulator
VNATQSTGEDFLMPPADLLEMTAEVVAAFVSNNSVPTSELPALIQTVHATVAGLSKGADRPATIEETKEPAVPIRKSITPDYLICLDDGKHFKSLKRHLAALGLTPEQYRAKWKLPPTYPMVAPNYAAKRSALAKAIGLGQTSGPSGGRKAGRPPKAAKT